MLFNSIQFLVFFIVVTLAYFCLSWRGRWMLLLAASCYFYMVFNRFLHLILFATIVIDYYAGIWISQTKDQKQKKLLLIISLISNIGILCFFKYYDFLENSFNHLLGSIGLRPMIPHLERVIPQPVLAWMVNNAGHILLPIGLSFIHFRP